MSVLRLKASSVVVYLLFRNSEAAGVLKSGPRAGAPGYGGTTVVSSGWVCLYRMGTCRRYRWPMPLVADFAATSF